MMEKFRESRRSSLRKEPSFKLENLSPEKYGKAAFQQMCYTPSKLADNVLYKDANNMKKYEQSSQKLRQVDAAYRLLQDKYNKLLKQKNGIEESLGLQVEMYKKLIFEMEEKAEERLKTAQDAFKRQVESIVVAKEEEAKFAQSEKEDLENAMQELENIGNQLEDRLNQTTSELRHTIDNLNSKTQEAKALEEKLGAAQQQHQAAIEKHLNNIEELKEKVMETQRVWREKRDEAINDKNKEIKQIQREQKQELNKLHEDREQERQKFSEQAKALTSKFETQIHKLGDVIESKNTSIEELNKKVADTQQKITKASKGYQQEIIQLTNEKSRLFEQVDKLNNQNSKLSIALKEIQIVSNKDKAQLESYVVKLKEDVSETQNSFLRERDRNIMTHDTSSKEIVILKRQNAALKAQIDDYEREVRALRFQIDSYANKMGDNKVLADEVKKLRDMLLESSFELQKCKEEYIKIGKQRDLLALRLQQANYDLKSFVRVKNERQQAYQTMREHSYLLRSRSSRRR